MSATEAPTEDEMLSMLAAINRLNPDLVKAFIGAVLRRLPRAEYLALIQQIERIR